MSARNKRINTSSKKSKNSSPSPNSKKNGNNNKIIGIDYSMENGIKERTILSGIHAYYEPEELIDTVQECIITDIKNYAESVKKYKKY